MTSRFIVVDYNRGKFDDPRIASDFFFLGAAMNEFREIKDATKSTCVVLFDTHSAEVLQIALFGEPIFLAKALTFARTFAKDKSLLEKAGEEAAKDIACGVISAIGKAIAGEAIPVGGVLLDHFIAPYDVFQGYRGRCGAFIWGMAGGVGLGGAAGALIKHVTEHPKCTKCNRAGLIGYYEVCPECEGYGYKK